MAIYNGTQKINVSGVDKIYVGTQLVYQKGPSWKNVWHNEASTIISIITNTTASAQTSYSGATTNLDFINNKYKVKLAKVDGIVTVYNNQSASSTRTTTISVYNTGTSVADSTTATITGSGTTSTTFSLSAQDYEVEGYGTAADSWITGIDANYTVKLCTIHAQTFYPSSYSYKGVCDVVLCYAPTLGIFKFFQRQVNETHVAYNTSTKFNPLYTALRQVMIYK